jgi:hypothetical protein
MLRAEKALLCCNYQIFLPEIILAMHNTNISLPCERLQSNSFFTCHDYTESFSNTNSFQVVVDPSPTSKISLAPSSGPYFGGFVVDMTISGEEFFGMFWCDDLTLKSTLDAQAFLCHPVIQISL